MHNLKLRKCYLLVVFIIDEILATSWWGSFCHWRFLPALLLPLEGNPIIIIVDSLASHQVWVLSIWKFSVWTDAFACQMSSRILDKNTQRKYTKKIHKLCSPTEKSTSEAWSSPSNREIRSQICNKCCTLIFPTSDWCFGLYVLSSILHNESNWFYCLSLRAAVKIGYAKTRSTQRCSWAHGAWNPLGILKTSWFLKAITNK